MRKIKSKDTVIVIAGKDKGRQGSVLKILEQGQKALVENINLVKRHKKGNPQTGEKSQIITKEMPIHISNVALLNPNTNKADRVGFKINEDGKKVRYFKSDGTLVDTI
ncbi:MAG: 50S ribosomal protein L24 [Gammaproteobacteria bacterium]